LAERLGWTGYGGMVSYWREFVALTDELFQRARIKKFRIDNSAGNWEDCGRQALASLGLQQLPEPKVTPAKANALTGVYRDRASGREFEVTYDGSVLAVDLFSPVRSKLVPVEGEVLTAEGWHFLIRFEPDAPSGTMLMRIDGRDVDYLRLAGTVAERVTP